jgi:hypothetical protein
LIDFVVLRETIKFTYVEQLVTGCVIFAYAYRRQLNPFLGSNSGDSAKPATSALFIPRCGVIPNLTTQGQVCELAGRLISLRMRDWPLQKTNNNLTGQ